MENIILELTPEQAEMLKMCLCDALESYNDIRSKWARIFIDAINEEKARQRQEEN